MLPVHHKSPRSPLQDLHCRILVVLLQRKKRPTFPLEERVTVVDRVGPSKNPANVSCCKKQPSKFQARPPPSPCGEARRHWTSSLPLSWLTWPATHFRKIHPFPLATNFRAQKKGCSETCGGLIGSWIGVFATKNTHANNIPQPRESLKGPDQEPWHEAQHGDVEATTSPANVDTTLHLLESCQRVRPTIRVTLSRVDTSRGRNRNWPRGLVRPRVTYR